MIVRALVFGAVSVAMLSLAACAEKPQTLDAASRKSDEPAWAVSSKAEPAFAAPGWKAGDKTAWEAQIRARNQAQNDYAR